MSTFIQLKIQLYMHIFFSYKRGDCVRENRIRRGNKLAHQTLIFYIECNITVLNPILLYVLLTRAPSPTIVP